MAAAVVIGFRYACGYEYTGALRTYNRKIPARKSPAQAIFPKKLSKRLPRGQKKLGKTCFLVILLSCYYVISDLFSLKHLEELGKGLNASTRGC